MRNLRTIKENHVDDLSPCVSLAYGHDVGNDRVYTIFGIRGAMRCRYAYDIIMNIVPIHGQRLGHIEGKTSVLYGSKEIFPNKRYIIINEELHLSSLPHAILTAGGGGRGRAQT